MGIKKPLKNRGFSIWGGGGVYTDLNTDFVIRHSKFAKSYIYGPNLVLPFEHKYKISKVKCTLLQALRLCTGRTTHRGSRGIALLFLDHGTRRGEGSASRPSRSLPPGKTRYPLYRRLGGPQGRSGQVRKISPPPGLDPWTVQPVVSRYTD